MSQKFHFQLIVELKIKILQLTDDFIEKQSN